MRDTMVDGFIGWSVGYTYSLDKRREDEIRQGKNYYLSSMCQVGQLTSIGVLISKINDLLPAHTLKTAIKVACNVVPLLSIPPLLYCASVKHGEYRQHAQLFNSTKYAYIGLPERLGGRTVTVLSFFAEHSGNIFRVIMVAASVGLIALGNVPYGAGVLIALSYEAIDSLGFVPRRISLFMEIHMPTVALVGMIVGGTLITRTFAVVSLSSHIFPYFAHYLHEKIDALIRRYFKMEGISLKAINAPLVEKQEMTFDEIIQILDADRSDFEINPAHYGHALVDLDKLPRDDSFEKFLTLFDAIDWESNFDPLVLAKLKYDDRFIDFLLMKNPGKTKKEIQDNMVSTIEQLAEQEHIPKERFASNWLREQMVSFVEKLQGKKRARGLQQDLDEAIQDSAILLPYISTLQDVKEQEEDILKLTVEGGDYCARGLKRTTNELMRGIIQAGIQQDDDLIDPIRIYEMQVMQALQNTRHDIIQRIYLAIVKQRQIPGAVAQDTHNFDTYRTLISFGFYPLTKHERDRVGLPHLIGWEFFNRLRLGMYSLYQLQLDQTVVDIGNVYFTDYLQRIVAQNDQLTQKQKDALIDKFVDMNDGQWTLDQTLEKFHTLMFVRLGVLLPKSAPAA